MGSAGLTIDYDADNGKAVEAVNYLRKTYGDAFIEIGKKSRDGMDRMNEGILNAHHSTHLLLEEFGIRLPRAVTGAIAEALPAISGFGGAILAGFAIKEIPHMVDGVRNLVEGWEGFGQAEKTSMQKAINDLKTLHGEVVSVEHELDLFGKKQSEQAALRAKWAGENADSALKVLGDAEKKLGELKQTAEGADKALSVYSLNTGENFKGAIEAQTALVDAARERWKKADDQALLEQKRAREAMDVEIQKNAASVEKSEESFERWQKTVGKTFGPTLKQLNPIMQVFGKATEDAVQPVALLEAYFKEPLTILPLEQNLKGLGQEYRRATMDVGHLRGALDLLTGAQDHSTQSLAENTAAVAQNIAGLLDTLGAKRAYAAVMAVYEAAQGYEALGNYDFWGAAQDFASSAMYAKVAGTGEHRHRATAVDRGPADSYRGGFDGGRGGEGYLSQSGTLAPGASGAGRFGLGSGIIVVHGSADLHQMVAGLVNGAVSRGINVTATSSMRGAPVGH